jgi:hypothetical protein
MKLLSLLISLLSPLALGQQRQSEKIAAKIPVEDLGVSFDGTTTTIEQDLAVVGNATAASYNGMGFVSISMSGDCTNNGTCGNVVSFGDKTATIARSGVGSYFINFSSPWATNVHFSCSALSFRGSPYFCYSSTGNTASNYIIACVDAAGNSVDTRLSITCMGKL